MTHYTGINTYRAARRKLVALLLLLLIILAYVYSASRPDLVEEKYSRGVYPAIASFWGGVTSAISFSIAEILVYAAVLAVIVRIVRSFVRAFRERTAAGKAFYLLDLLLSGALAFAAVCALFILLWGFNYNRLPFSETSGLNAAPAPVRVLEQSCLLLVEQANELREDVREDADGVMALSVPMRNTLGRAREGFRVAAAEFETLGSVEPGKPKPVLASVLLSYAGITGVYFPITAEANINTDITGAETPFTICHELAHQLGYAREDEANFIAWVACANSPYEDYRYSGAVMALLNLLKALNGRDAAAWGRIRGMCSPAVNRDLNSMGQYWQSFEGPVSDISETINDTFLKANRQEDGVQSYGRMVDLVIAYLRANGLSAA